MAVNEFAIGISKTLFKNIFMYDHIIYNKS